MSRYPFAPLTAVEAFTRGMRAVRDAGVASSLARARYMSWREADLHELIGADYERRLWLDMCGDEAALDDVALWPERAAG